ncbi:TPA: hypothetical protein ACJHE1_004388 [Yersinia enterocolitica]
MDITKSREEFHKWLESRDCNPVAWLKDAYWEVWKASRESLEVELPAKITAKDTHWTTPNKMREALVLSLRTAGIRIKGESNGTK